MREVLKGKSTLKSYHRRITPKLETVKRQILYTEPTIYSKLPNDIKQIENSSTFKKNLYQFLLKNGYFPF